MKQITGTVKTWLPEWSSLSPEQLQTPEAISEFVFSRSDMRDAGWTYIGEATITVDVVLRPDELIASKIETLKAQQNKVRAEAQERVNQLEAMVQNLLAITYTPEAS
jgi:hypothetical protein